jgi:endo-alpha-1,4-polygalactosaminidase (GH114 family)
LPPKAGRFDYQLSGPATFTPTPQVVERDNGDKPWAGAYNICYINGYQSQPGDTSLKPYFLLSGGKPVEDPNWPGEYVLDTRHYATQLTNAMAAIVKRCADSGFKAVEFDNLDSYDRSGGLLSVADNVGYAKSLIAVTHARGLAVAQKNSVELVGQMPFDFAVTEECVQYQECTGYTKYFSVVYDVEYQGEISTSEFQAGCTKYGGGKAMSFEYRDVQLTPKGTRAWCDGVTPQMTS